MNFKDIRTAVVGVGSMGQNHARVLNEISNLVGVVDLDKVIEIDDNTNLTGELACAGSGCEIT